MSNIIDYKREKKLYKVEQEISHLFWIIEIRIELE